MERLATWVLAGLLAYICLVLTSINNKIDVFNATTTEVAVLNEVKNQSYRSTGESEIVPRQSSFKSFDVMDAGYALMVLMAVFASWHFSRIYHTHLWTKKILRKNYAQNSGPAVDPAPRELIHMDQDCIAEPPSIDGRIKDSWLPPHARSMRAGW